MVDILLRRDPVWVNELLSPVSAGTVTLIAAKGRMFHLNPDAAIVSSEEVDR